MICIMSGYEKVDFFSNFDVRALKWFQKSPEGQNVLKESKTKVKCTASAQWYILAHSRQGIGTQSLMHLCNLATTTE